MMNMIIDKIIDASITPIITAVFGIIGFFIKKTADKFMKKSKLVEPREFWILYIVAAGIYVWAFFRTVNESHVKINSDWALQGVGISLLLLLVLLFFCYLYLLLVGYINAKMKNFYKKYWFKNLEETKFNMWVNFSNFIIYIVLFIIIILFTNTLPLNSSKNYLLQQDSKTKFIKISVSENDDKNIFYIEKQTEFEISKKNPRIVNNDKIINYYTDSKSNIYNIKAGELIKLKKGTPVYLSNQTVEYGSNDLKAVDKVTNGTFSEDITVKLENDTQVIMNDESIFSFINLIYILFITDFLIILVYKIGCFCIGCFKKKLSTVTHI